MSNKANLGLPARALALGALMALGFSSEMMAQKVSKTEKVGSGLYEIAVSEKGNAVYVAATGGRGGGANGKIYKLDVKTLAIVDSIEVQNAKPMGLAINDKTQTLYTSSPGANPVNAIDLKTGKTIPIKSPNEKAHVREVIVDEAKNLIYATDLGEQSSIWVIDGKTNTYLYSIENCGQTTTALALDAGRQLLYVTQMKTNEIGVVDLASKKMIKSFPAHGSKPINLVYDSKGDRIFVADQGTNELIVLKASNGDLIKKIPAGKGTLGVRFDAVKKRVYTANRQDGTVTVVNADTYEVISTLQAGSAPNTIAINSKTGAAYVSNKTKAIPRGQGGGGRPQAGAQQGKPAEGQPAGEAVAQERKPQAERPAPAPDPNGDTVTMILP